VRVEGGFHYGVLVSASDAALATGLVWPRARLEVAGTFWTPSSVPEAEAAGRVGRATIGTVGLRGCWTPKARNTNRRIGAGPLEFPLCGGAELGTFRFETLGVEADVQYRLWAAVSVTAALAWPVHRNVALWVGPTGVLILRRPRFTFPNSRGAYEIGPAAIRAFVGVDLRFP
jgi:hypothetical protein